MEGFKTSRLFYEEKYCSLKCSFRKNYSAVVYKKLFIKTKVGDKLCVNFEVKYLLSTLRKLLTSASLSSGDNMLYLTPSIPKYKFMSNTYVFLVWNAAYTTWLEFELLDWVSNNYVFTNYSFCCVMENN